MDHTYAKNRFVKWAFIVAIIIVLNLFFNYAISLVYPSPQFEQFCPAEKYNATPATKESCLALGGQWNETSFVQEKSTSSAPAKVTPTPPSKELQVTGYCNTTFTCQRNFDTAYKAYARNVFIALVVLGIATLIIGLFWRINDSVSIALSFGGVLSLIIASIRYWTEAQNILKVAILGIALIALLWIGIKKFN